MKQFILITIILLSIVGEFTIAQEEGDSSFSITNEAKVLDSRMMVDKLNKSLREKQVALKKLSTQFEEAKLKLEIASERNEDLALELSADKKSRYSNLESASKAKLTAFAQNAEYLRDRITHRDVELGKAEARITVLEAQIASYRTASLQSGDSTHSSSLITSRLKSLEKQHRLQTDALNKLIQGQMNVSSINNQKHETETVQLKQQLEAVRAKNASLIKASESKDQELAQLKRQMDEALGAHQQSIVKLETQLKASNSNASSLKNLQIKHQVAQNLVEAQKAELLNFKSQKPVVVNQIAKDEGSDPEKVAHLNNRLLEAQKSLRNLAATNGALEKEVAVLKQQDDVASSKQLEAATQKHLDAQAVIRSLKLEIESKKAKTESNLKLVGERDEKIKGLQTLVAGLRSRITTAEANGQDSVELTKQNEALRIEVEKSKATLAKKDEEIQLLNHKIDLQGKQLVKEIGLHSNNMQMLTSFRNKHSDLSKELVAVERSTTSTQELSKELKSLQSKLDSTKTSNNDLKKRIADLEQQLKLKRVEHQKSEEKLKTLLVTQKEASAKFQALSITRDKEASTSAAKLQNSIAELLSVKKQNSELETKLQSGLEGLQKEKTELVEKLAVLTSERAQVDSHFTSLKEKKQASDVELVKALAEREDLQKLIRQQDAELLIMSSKVTSAGELDNQLTSLQQKLKTTEETTEGVKVELKAANEKLQQKQSSYEKAKAELDTIKQSSIDAKKLLEEKNLELSKIQKLHNTTLAEHKEALEQLEEKDSQLADLLEACNTNVTDKEEALKLVEAKKLELAGLKKAKEDAIEAKQKALKQLESTQVESKKSTQLLNASLAGLTTQINSLSEDKNLKLASLSTEKSQLKTQLEQSQKTLQAVQTEKASLSKTLKAELAEKQALAALLKKEKEAKLKLSSQLEKKDHEATRLAKLGDTKAIEIASAHKQNQQYTAKLKGLETKLADTRTAKQKLEAMVEQLTAQKDQVTKASQTKQIELEANIAKSDEGLMQLSKELATLRKQIKTNEDALKQEQSKSVQLTAALEEQMSIQTNTREILYGIDPVFFASAQDIDYVQRATVLNQVKKILRIYPNAKFRVTGHTDNKGDAETNLYLSKSRAEKFVTYLVANGVEAERITHLGIGQNRPIGDNNTWEGRAKNRRVEVEVYSD